MKVVNEKRKDEKEENLNRIWNEKVPMPSLYLIPCSVAAESLLWKCFSEFYYNNQKDIPQNPILGDCFRWARSLDGQSICAQLFLQKVVVPERIHEMDFGDEVAQKNVVGMLFFCTSLEELTIAHR